MVECVWFFSGFWYVGVDDVEFIFGKLFGKDTFTKFTGNGDLLKLFHNESIIFMNGFGFAYGHTRKFFDTRTYICEIL